MKQAVLAIQGLLRQPMLLTGSPFSAPDRAALSLIRTRAEQVDVARRYWACPF